MRPSATRTATSAPVSTPATELTTWPSASWSTAYPRRSVASGDSARARARWCARSSVARSRACRRLRRARSRSRSTSSARASTSERGSASDRSRPQRVEAGLLAGERTRSSRSGSARGPGRPRAAPRRRRGRPAWRRRSGWTHGRRPRGRAAAGRARARSRTRRACAPGAPPGSAPRRRTAAGPPPSRRLGRPRSPRRRGRGRAGRRASITSAAARVPCMAACATSKRTAGQRRRAFSSTSRSAAELGAVTSPTQPGRNGSAPLELRREQPLGGQQLPASLEPGQQLAEADHADLAGVQRQGAAVGVVGRLGVDHDARALDERRIQPVEQGPRAGDRHGDVGHGVAQRQEDRVDARVAG